MTCEAGFKNVGGVVCLPENDNPFVSSIVGLFLSIDKDMGWGYNFSKYGAKNRNKINAPEIFVALGVDKDEDKTNVGLAIMTVFG